jgi:hypothetical protein
MASGASNIHITAKRGAAADLTVNLPFTPAMVKLYVASGGTIEQGVKTAMMAGSAYLSTSTGVDAGVTIGDRKITIANGADVNVAGADIHIIAYDSPYDV